MSYIDASQFAGTGVDQLFPDHEVHGQNIVDGIVALTPKAAPMPKAPHDAVCEPSSPRPRTALPHRSGCDILRDTGRAQPHGPVGNAARRFLREEPIFKRIHNKSVKRERQKKMQHIITAACKQPKLAARLKARPQPQRQRQIGRYDILKKAAHMHAKAPPAFTAKTISLKQLPLAHGLQKAAGLISPQAALAVKAGLGLAAMLADRPSNSPAHRKSLPAHCMG